jgi:hypothetical protein
VTLRSRRVAILLSATVLTGACGGGSSSSTSRPTTTAASAVPEAQRPHAVRAAAMFDGDGPAPFIAALRAKFGENVRLMDVTIYPDRANVRVQDPARPENLDDWQWSAKDGLHDSRPVHTSKSDAFGPKLFGVGDVRWDKLPALAKTALERLALPDAAVTHANIDRGSDGVAIRLFVDGPRRGGFLDAAADGRVLKVEQN